MLLVAYLWYKNWSMIGDFLFSFWWFYSLITTFHFIFCVVGTDWFTILVLLNWDFHHPCHTHTNPHSLWANSMSELIAVKCTKGSESEKKNHFKRHSLSKRKLQPCLGYTLFSAAVAVVVVFVVVEIGYLNGFCVLRRWERTYHFQQCSPFPRTQCVRTVFTVCVPRSMVFLLLLLLNKKNTQVSHDGGISLLLSCSLSASFFTP